jgi:hypothetical protein
MKRRESQILRFFCFGPNFDFFVYSAYAEKLLWLEFVQAFGLKCSYIGPIRLVPDWFFKIPTLESGNRYFIGHFFVLYGIFCLYLLSQRRNDLVAD